MTDRYKKAVVASIDAQLEARTAHEKWLAAEAEERAAFEEMVRQKKEFNNSAQLRLSEDRLTLVYVSPPWGVNNFPEG